MVLGRFVAEVMLQCWRFADDFGTRRLEGRRASSSLSRPGEMTAIRNSKVGSHKYALSARDANEIIRQDDAVLRHSFDISPPILLAFRRSELAISFLYHDLRARRVHDSIKVLNISRSERRIGRADVALSCCVYPKRRFAPIPIVCRSSTSAQSTPAIEIKAGRRRRKAMGCAAGDFE